MEKQKPKKRIPITAFAKPSLIKKFQSEPMRKKLKALHKGELKWSVSNHFGRLLEITAHDPEKTMEFLNRMEAEMDAD